MTTCSCSSVGNCNCTPGQCSCKSCHNGADKNAQAASSSSSSSTCSCVGKDSEGCVQVQTVAAVIKSKRYVVLVHVQGRLQVWRLVLVRLVWQEGLGRLLVLVEMQLRQELLLWFRLQVRQLLEEQGLTDALLTPMATL
ncbi:hypothetical protein JCM10908_001292 [Rhodotorula pacifica]|uniref:uncharacterized protein n=1 Tax=Rhodotorula pacifica TaxID=1495444 RepID=UPI00317BC687